jgi:PAS domain S-box-containing protein
LSGETLVPLSRAFESHGLFDWTLRLRRKPLAAWGIGLVLIAVATFARWSVTGQIVAGPFVTYYPAIIIATLTGGFWIGIISMVVAGLIGWYAFLPPVFSFALTEQGTVSLLLFVFLSGLDVAIVALLNALVVRTMAQEQNVRVLVENAPNGILVVDDQGTIKLVNTAAEKLFGYKRLELLGQNVELLVPYRQIDNHIKQRGTYLHRPEARAMGVGRDLSGRSKDGNEFPIEVGLSPIEQEGRCGVVATVVDISERVRAHEHQKFLVRELQHRTQNLFAVVQSIIARSLIEGQTVAQAKQVIAGRLQALARTHAILDGTAWEGAPLREILKREFDTDFSNHVDINGCDIVVNASAAHQFALIVHELGTNAIKYGALSAPGGHISIVGSIKQTHGASQFSMLWSESGGPLVAMPTRKGFGSIVLFDAAKQFGMDINVNYDPTGLIYQLRVPVHEIQPSKVSEIVTPPDGIAI